MKTLLWLLLVGVAFVLGMTYELERRPPREVRIVKQDGSRCELLDRIRKEQRRRM